MVVGECEGWGVELYNMEHTQIITIHDSSRARHAEGRQIKKANGSWGDAVWSNLVQKAWWWLREKGGEGVLNPHHKKKRYTVSP